MGDDHGMDASGKVVRTPPPSEFATDPGNDMFPTEGSLDQNSFDRLLSWANLRRASDITIQPGAPVMGEIAGAWRPLTRLPLSDPEVQGIIRGIYSDNGPSAVSTGRALDFPYEFKNPMRAPDLTWEKGYEKQPTKLRFRVNVTGGRIPNGGGDGASITMRSLPTQPIEISKLGVESDVLKYWRPEQGLNLVCGPTGSGKSTLLSSLVRWRCEQPDANEKIVEFSAPIEYVYDDLTFPSSIVWQTGAGYHLIDHDDRSEGGIWNYCIRNSLRRKPSTIILGEARDRYTIEGCIQAALSGHLTITTLHTIGVPETFRRLVMPFAPSERGTISVDLLQVLNMVVTQLLVPRIGGGKQAVREYIVFDGGVRRALEEASHDDWPKMLRRMLAKGQTEQGHPIIGQAMDKAIEILFHDGKVSAESMNFIKKRTLTETN